MKQITVLLQSLAFVSEALDVKLTDPAMRMHVMVLRCKIGFLQNLNTSNVNKAIHQHGDQHLVQFKNISIECMIIPLENLFVKKYIKKKKEQKPKVV